MILPPDDVERILEAMRAGFAVGGGSTRLHHAYAWRDGAWRHTTIEEWEDREEVLTEAQLRALVAREPEIFVQAIRKRAWRAMRDAWLREDRAAALAHLDEATRFGDFQSRGAIWRAVLRAPEPPPDADLLRESIRNMIAFHAFVEAMEARTADVGRQGLAFLDTLVSLVGEAPGVEEMRRSFRKLGS